MWTIRAKSESEAEILLYDDIDAYWGKSAKDFVNEVRALGAVSEIALRINSAGGDIFEAQAMYSYLRMHGAHKTVRIDGLAASAASVVAMAGDRVIMPSNALMMIHNPWSWTYGEAEDMRKVADLLDRVRDTIATVYRSKTGLDHEKIVSMMDDETWMNADEAFSMGFCDETDEPVEIAACARSLTEGDIAWRTAAGAAKFSRALAAKMPDSAKKVPLKLMSQPGKITKNEEDQELDIKNVEELEKAFPQFVSELRGTVEAAACERGARAERERLKTLDGLTGPGRDAIIARAKYEDPKDARDVAMELLQADSNVAALAARQEDAAVVNAVLQPTINGTAETATEEIAARVADEINEKRGYKHE
ncbi:MAG: Clp protease ClpP [Synergistaceae bacterium]|jgi:ATP-dependent protease ClpP protease subunit|nr:Clp protease ClpP [Synergistaceae bacterium]